MSKDEIKKDILLSGFDVSPECSNHNPIMDLEEGIVHITCENCGFHAVLHPDELAKINPR